MQPARTQRFGQAPWRLKAPLMQRPKHPRSSSSKSAASPVQRTVKRTWLFIHFDRFQCKHQLLVSFFSANPSSRPNSAMRLWTAFRLLESATSKLTKTFSGDNPWQKATWSEFHSPASSLRSATSWTAYSICHCHLHMICPLKLCDL